MNWNSKYKTLIHYQLFNVTHINRDGRVQRKYLWTIEDLRRDDVAGSVKLVRRSRFALVFFGCEPFFTDSEKKLLQKLRRRGRFASLLISSPTQSSGDRKLIFTVVSQLILSGKCKFTRVQRSVIEPKPNAWDDYYWIRSSFVLFSHQAMTVWIRERRRE